MLVLLNVMMKLSNVRKKKWSTIKCDKSMVKCNIGIAQCDNGTVKCEKKNRVPPNVTKVQSYVMLVLPIMTIELSNVKNKIK